MVRMLAALAIGGLLGGCVYTPYPYGYGYPGYAYRPAYVAPAVVVGGYGYRGYRYY